MIPYIFYKMANGSMKYYTCFCRYVSGMLGEVSPNLPKHLSLDNLKISSLHVWSLVILTVITPCGNSPCSIMGWDASSPRWKWFDRRSKVVSDLYAFGSSWWQLGMQLFGPANFLFKGVILEADTPLERFTWALNLLWKCLDHLDSHKSHLKRKISVVIHSQRDQPDVIMSLLYRFNMWHPIALVDGPMTPCFRTI